MSLYRSPYEAYPFLADQADDLRCDFEVLTDQISAATGLLAAWCPEYQQELLRVDELVYHANASLRTFCSLSEAEVLWLKERIDQLAAGVNVKGFVLPAGSKRGCLAHVLRTLAKQLVRLLYRHAEQGHAVDDILFDFANLLSGYYFHLALALNQAEGVAEIPFVSRNYK